MKPFTILPVFMGSILFAMSVQAFDKILTSNTETDWTYVSVGLEPAMSTEGVELLRGNIADDDMSSGYKIHHSEAGGSLNDQWSNIINLPFSFNFYGMPFDRFCVSKNGLLTFDISVSNTVFQTSLISPLDTSTEPEHLLTTTGTMDLAPENIDNTLYIPNNNELLPGSSDKKSFTLPHSDLPNNTIAYYWGRFISNNLGNDIYYFIYGSAPHRQAWIINSGHNKKGQFNTHTALVLEETSNRFFVIDMSADDPEAESGHLTVGAQYDSEMAQSVPASPTIRVVGESTNAEDNAMYIFQPYQRQTKINGYSHASINTIFDEAISNHLEKNNLPGALVAASKDGRLVFSKAYGYANVETDIEMKPWHRSGIGSVSKVLTAIGVMKVKEMSEALGLSLGGSYSPNNSFSLDQPLYGANGVFADINFEENILNGITDGLNDGIYQMGMEAHWLEAYHAITPRHLLTHTAGFREATDKAVNAAKHFDISYEDLTYKDIHRYVLDVKQLGSTPPNANLSPLLPAAVRKYSNHSYGVSGLLIQAVTDTPYIDFMQNEIFMPLGLNITNTLTDYDDLTTSDAKRYYYYRSHTSYHSSNFDGSRVYGAYGIGRGDTGAAAGGWVTSARDLVRLLCATDRLNNHSDILQPATLDEMESIPFPYIADYQPLGWDSKNTAGRLQKNGKTGAMGAYMAKYPSGVNVAIIFNSGSGVNLPTKLSGELEVIIKNSNIPEDYDLFINQLAIPILKTTPLSTQINQPNEIPLKKTISKIR